jgi:hypothetical protein
VGRNWYQSIHFDELSCRQVSFTLPQGTPSREEQKLFQRLEHILTLSQPVGLVIFLSGQILMLLQRWLALKITIVDAEMFFGPTNQGQ